MKKTKICYGKVCLEKRRNIKFFKKDKSKKDGFQAYCVDCVKAYNIKYRTKNKKELCIKKKKYNNEHKNERKKYFKEYTKIHKEKLTNQRKKWEKEHKDEIKKYRKIYYKNNKIKILKQNKNYRIKHKNKIYLVRKEWSKNNINKERQYARKKKRRRREIAKNLQEIYTIEHESITLKAFHNKCFNCHSKNKLCIDHHRPLSKGNPLTLNNAVVLCKFCNSSKGAKPPESFYGKKKCAKLDKKLKKIVQLYSK